MTPPDSVPGYIGQVLDAAANAVGTCFQIASGIFVTASHVLAGVGASVPGSAVRIAPLAGDGNILTAQVRAVDEGSDLAILTSDYSLTDSARGLLATSSVTASTHVQVTGVSNFPDSRPFRFTSTTGVWQGLAQYLDGILMGQMDAKNLVKGMSGAPVRRSEDDFVVGVVSSRYNSGPTPYLQHSVWISRTEDLSALLGGLASRFPLLPDPAARYVSSAAEGFVGRDYVFDAFNSFLRSNPKGIFTLVGDPGEGKTAICAELARRTGCAVHFNSRPEGINTAAQCLANIGGQLAIDFGIPNSSRAVGSDLATDWIRLIERAAAAAAATYGKKVLIALDALDEVDRAGSSEGANVLLLPSALPDNVYLFLTKRRVDVPLVSLASQLVYDLNDHRSESLDDIKSFLRQAIERGTLDRWIESQDLTVEEAISILAIKSQYNFMYLHYVIPQIAEGIYTTTGHTQLPDGLRGYYEDHWTRMGMRVRPVPRKKLMIICGLAEVRRPVSPPFLAELLQQDLIDVQEILTEWRQFLVESSESGRQLYSIYHASFADFLRSKEILGAAQQSLSAINSSIADRLQAELFGTDK